MADDPERASTIWKLKVGILGFIKDNRHHITR